MFSQAAGPEQLVFSQARLLKVWKFWLVIHQPSTVHGFLENAAQDWDRHRIAKHESKLPFGESSSFPRDLIAFEPHDAHELI